MAILQSNLAGAKLGSLLHCHDLSVQEGPDSTIEAEPVSMPQFLPLCLAVVMVPSAVGATRSELMQHLHHTVLVAVPDRANLDLLLYAPQATHERSEHWQYDVHKKVFIERPQVSCKLLDQRASASGAHIPASESGYRVSGKGRVHFYSAPAEHCRLNALFLVPGDQVEAYVEEGGYVSVMYFRRDGSEVQGWLPLDRLRSTGTGVGPSQPE